MREEELLARAVAMAADKHKKQTRKDGTPYIYHLFKVAEMVKDAGYGIKYQVVAILHDALEDTDTTEGEIAVFGDDVVRAVKLLTKSSHESEDQYVEKILSDHMASVVKNADKIHNVWDASYCADKRWSRKYIKKAQQYYEGKFSNALDDAIGIAQRTVCVVNAKKTWKYYDTDKMMLKTDKMDRMYEERKGLYERCVNRPDFANINMQYWHSDIGNYYFCFIDDDNVWCLGQAGWLPLYGNPIRESEYGNDLTLMSREEVAAFIEQKKNEGYFYDFVDLSRL